MPADGGWPPSCVAEAEHLSRSASPGTGRRYGLRRARRIFGLARSTASYPEARGAAPPERRPAPRKRGPKGPCSDEELVSHIRPALAEGPFHGGGYRKAWARLRHRGLRSSQERVRRLMRGHHLRAPRRGGHPHGPKAHDGTITTAGPDTMWGADLTTAVTTGEGAVHVPGAVDHCACECVGLHAAKGGDRLEALGPLRQGVREHFGGFEQGIAEGLSIRHGHGSAYMSGDSPRELEFPGITGSPSFVREPEGDGCAERLIRTLKENLPRVRSFATVAELVEALREFGRTYNERRLIGRHGHRSPSQVRRDLVISGVPAA